MFCRPFAVLGLQKSPVVTSWWIWTDLMRESTITLACYDEHPWPIRGIGSVLVLHRYSASEHCPEYFLIIARTEHLVNWGFWWPILGSCTGSASQLVPRLSSCAANRVPLGNPWYMIHVSFLLDESIACGTDVSNILQEHICFWDIFCSFMFMYFWDKNSDMGMASQ